MPAAVDPVPVPAAGFTGRIELRDVRFAYGTGSTLDGADIEAKTSGEAISGVSFTIDARRNRGARRPDRRGQVHVVKLMARFYDVTGGAVLVDGVDVRKYDLTEFQHRLGVVPQEAYLFSGSVAEAIALRAPRRVHGRDRGARRAPSAHTT